MPAVIEPLGHHELLLVLLQLGLLLTVARLLGELARRVGLPTVVGELLAGIVLGPSLLGSLAPGVFDFVFPAQVEQRHLLEVVSWLGVIMLLILTGLETDIALIVRKGKSAAAISIGGIVVPFATGFALAQVLPGEFIAAPDQRLVFSLFIGTAMSISAIPVIAKVLVEMRVIRRDIGQITLAAGMIDDTIGWILLSVVAGLARGGGVSPGSVGMSLFSVVAFLGLAFTLGRKLVQAVIRRVDNATPGDAGMLSALIALALLFGTITQALGLEAVLGAFVVGILVGQIKRFNNHLRHLFEVVVLSAFAPIFFAASGLRVDLGALMDPSVLMVGLVVLAIAIFGKFAGAYVGARAGRLGHWEALSLGAGMNARGAMEIIVATIGLSLGVLTQEMYTIILMVAIVTSLMAPPILRWTLARIPMSDEERARLAREERAKTSFLGNLARVLLPARGGLNDQIAAQLVGRMVHGHDIEVTTMYVGEDEDAKVDAAPDDVPVRATLRTKIGTDARERMDRVEAQVTDRSDADLRRLVRVDDPLTSETVLAEAARDYHLVVMGAEERPQRRPDEPLFTPVVDQIISEAPCPVMIVSSRGGSDPDRVVDDLDIRRILLPVAAAGEGDMRAAETAFAIAGQTAVVDVVHVLNSPQLRVSPRDPDLQSARQIGRDIVAKVAEVGHEMGVRVRTQVLVGEHAEQTIVELSEQYDTDLVVLNGHIRPVSHRAFLGHRTDHVLRYAPCPVVLVGES
jgi:Kef-type K+ transport system membrane component KefB/nucleotide-binding universal stress UspA family protein